MTINKIIKNVTDKIIKRSASTRSLYLEKIIEMEDSSDSDRLNIACSNMAHATASSPESEKGNIYGKSKKLNANIAIISAYNDMLSAHKPYESYPKIIKETVKSIGASAQFAAGVPAMCDGITQGRPGMQLSLLSRDVIAMSTSIGLSHGVFDGVLCLGICDKIVPGLLMGVLSFGYLPVIFLPAGPMTSGLPNIQKAEARKAFAMGKISRDDLLETEMQSYHSPGTCTFYGTANSNQMLMEIMGLHLPGSSFINPEDDLRHMLTVAATKRVVEISRQSKQVKPIGKLLSEKSFVNAIVGLLATGGSTNHTLHLPAIASTAGIQIIWEDFEELSKITPLLSKIYPSGSADINQFHAAGGMSFLINELLEAGLIHHDVDTVWGNNLYDYIKEPFIQNDNTLEWRPLSNKSLNEDILRSYSKPFKKEGGIKILKGNIGKAVIKTSALENEKFKISAPAMVFKTESSVQEAFDSNKLNCDVIIVMPFQGPKANGMPELHGLTSILSIIQDKGYKVALLTDGRMSGASGKVPAIIHVCPEAADGGMIGLIEDGNIIGIDLIKGNLNVTLSKNVSMKVPDKEANNTFGRSIFSNLRSTSSSAEEGGGINLIKSFK